MFDLCVRMFDSRTRLMAVFYAHKLHPKLRFEHVMLARWWFGPTEPVMHMFLRPFVQQANSLVSEGVSWKTDGEET